MTGPETLAPAQIVSEKIRTLVWSEGSEPFDVYPDGIHGLLAGVFDLESDIEAEPVFLSEPEQGVSEEKLAAADVLVWFGHVRHREVRKATAERVARRVRERGLGFLPLHSSHLARPFLELLGASGRWKSAREDAKPAKLRPVGEHPITAGTAPFELEESETYFEPFDAPEPEAVVLEGAYQGGEEKVRDGMVWTVGKGRIFYFRPGHEDYPIFHMPEVQRILVNGVRWLSRR